MLKPKELVVTWACWLEERCIGLLHRLCAGDPMQGRSWSGRGWARGNLVQKKITSEKGLSSGQMAGSA